MSRFFLGILLLLVGAVVGVFIWNNYRQQQTEETFTDVATPALEDIVEAYTKHMDEKHKAPASLDELTPYLTNDKLLPSLRSGSVVRYNIERGADAAANSKIVVAYVKTTANRKTPAVMLDGGIRALTPKELKEATGGD